MTTVQALWFMLSLGALCALGLAGCCMLVFWLLPRPERAGFEVRDDR